MRENNLKTGIAWNLVSYVFLGVFTILSYWLITWQYGKAELGAYNIVLSVFMICGHIGVFGLQSAAVYFIPQMSGDTKKLGSLLVSFAVIALVVSVLLGTVIYFAGGFIGTQVFGSGLIAEGLRRIALAVVLFSLNKMLGGFINGMGNMRGFAVLQGSRYFFIVSFIAVGVLAGAGFETIFYAFTVSELGVMIIGIVLLAGKIVPAGVKKTYIRQGVAFGSRAMCGNVISDINTRVDVMMLGMLCADTVVGVYSFVTIIAEGLLSILFVFRNNYNPRFSEMLYQGKYAELQEIFEVSKRHIRWLFCALGAMIGIGYGIFCKVFLETAYMQSILPVIIINVGCIIMAPYFVGGNICTLSGKPMIDTVVTIVTIGINILLNYIFIQRLEIAGAALATGISYVVFSMLTSYFMRTRVWDLHKEK